MTQSQADDREDTLITRVEEHRQSSSGSALNLVEAVLQLRRHWQAMQQAQCSFRPGYMIWKEVSRG
jgi:hypothetical protein